MKVKSISKALAAGFSAGVGAAGVYLQAHSFQVTTEHVAGALGAFVVAGVIAGVATYRAPANAAS